MPGLGTVINVALLIAGGLLGLIGGRFITPRIQDTLMKASGLCVLFIGLGGTCLLYTSPSPRDTR